MAHVALSQSIVREFCRIISPQLANRDPWTLTGPDRGKCTAILQARALPPLFTGGTFTCEHRQQHAAVSSVCERFLQNLEDSNLLPHGWRHWTSHWMREGAPDVMRFLMLSHALAAPGWMGREELVNIRGIPPGAQPTAHAVLDQLVRQGHLQGDPADVRYVAVAGRVQHKQHHDHLQQQQQQQSGFSQGYHLQYQPAQNSAQQPGPAQDFLHEQQPRPGEYQTTQVFSVQEQQPQYHGAVYITQAQQQPQYHSWQDQNPQQQQQPYQYTYEVQQPQQQSVQVRYVNDLVAGQQEYKAATDTSYLYPQHRQQGAYQDPVMYTLPSQQLVSQQHDSGLETRAGGSVRPYEAWQVQYSGQPQQPQQQQQQYMFPGPSQPQLMVEQSYVPPAGPSSTGGHSHMHTSMQQYSYIPVAGGDNVPRASDGGHYAGHTLNVPSAPAASAAQHERHQQQWQERGEPSRGRPMKRAHNDRAGAAHQSNDGVGGSWWQDSRDRGSYGKEYGSSSSGANTARPARSNSPNKRPRTYEHPHAYGPRGRASDPPRQQQQQQPATRQPHRPGTSGREALLGSSQPGYYQRHGTAAPAGAAGGGSGRWPGTYSRGERGPAVPDRATCARGADRPQHPQQPPAERAWGEHGKWGKAAAAASSEAAPKGVQAGMQPAAADDVGQPVQAATGTAAAAAAVMSVAVMGQQHTSLDPAAPAASAQTSKKKKKKGKKQGGKDIPAADLLLISRKQRQQQRHEQALARPLTPRVLSQLLVAELCDAAPFAVKVELLQQQFPVHAVHKPGGGRRGRQGGQHGANQHQVRDAVSLLAHLHQQGYVEVFKTAAPAGQWYARWLDDDWATRLISASDCEKAAPDVTAAAVDPQQAAAPGTALTDAGVGVTV